MKKLRTLKGNSPDEEYREDDFETLPSYMTRRSYAAGPLKSPLMQLKETGKDVKDKVVSQTGPPHCPTFVAEVTVDGRTYKGKGLSKQDARQNAAERALRHPRRYLPRPRERNHISDIEQEDFTDSEEEDDGAPKMTSLRADKLVLAVKDLTACHVMQGKVEVKGTFRLTLEDKRAFSVKKKLRKLRGNSRDKEYRQDDRETLPSYMTRRSYSAGPLKSPLMQLNEMGKEVDYNVVSQTGPPHCPTFVVEVMVDGRAYRGRGKSKKDARQNAAEKALRHLRRYLPRPRERNQISDSEEEDDHDDTPRMTRLRAGLTAQRKKLKRRQTVSLLTSLLRRRRRFSDSKSDTDYPLLYK